MHSGQTVAQVGKHGITVNRAPASSAADNSHAGPQGSVGRKPARKASGGWALACFCRRSVRSRSGGLRSTNTDSPFPPVVQGLTVAASPQGYTLMVPQRRCSSTSHGGGGMKGSGHPSTTVGGGGRAVFKSPRRIQRPCVDHGPPVPRNRRGGQLPEDVRTRAVCSPSCPPSSWCTVGHCEEPEFVALAKAGPASSTTAAPATARPVTWR